MSVLAVLGVAALGLFLFVIFVGGIVCMLRDRKEPPLTPEERMTWRDAHRPGRAYDRDEVIK